MDFIPGIYEHYKGGLYRGLFVAYLESTLVPHVVYEMLYDSLDFPTGTRWIRPLSVFFEMIEVPGGEVVPRFRLVEGGDAIL